MKLSQLRFFCAVVEYKTIAAAARELHCVPSNVTLRIKELEDSLSAVSSSDWENDGLVEDKSVTETVNL